MKRFTAIGMGFGAVLAGYFAVMSLDGGESTGQMYSSAGAGGSSSVLVTQEHGATMPGVFCIVWDDNRKELQPGGVINNIMLAHGIKAGFTVEGEAVENGDTVNTILSLADLQTLYAQGNEMGTAGYDETSGLYSGITSLLAQGYTQAQVDTFTANIAAGVAWAEANGLGSPRFHSYSNSSGCRVTALACQAAGIDYAVSSFIPPTVAGAFIDSLGVGDRNNRHFAVSVARWGMFGTGGSAGTNVSAHRGWRPNRYEIAQSLAESNTYAQWKAALDKAAQVGGLIVFNAHAATAAETSTGASWDSLMTLVESYIDAGLLVNLVPSEAFDHYYRRPVGPYTSFVPGTGNFDDVDGDGHLDMWGGGTLDGSSFTTADTALIRPWGTATSGHDGRKAYSLNWTGQEGVPMVAGQTSNDAWEDGRAYFVALPPQGGGYTARWEMWVSADSAGASYTSIAGDTVGVTFYGMQEGYANRWGSAAYNPSWVVAANGVFSPSASHILYSATGPSVGNFIRLGSRNNLSRTSRKQWASFIATWDVPEYVDYVIVVIWKTTQSPANGIVISDYSLTFSQRGTGAVMPQYQAIANPN